MKLTDKDKEKLCACPNCNSCNYLEIVPIAYHQKAIRCQNCGALSLPTFTKVQAIKEWNKFVVIVSAWYNHKLMDRK